MRENPIKMADLGGPPLFLVQHPPSSARSWFLNEVTCWSGLIQLEILQGCPGAVHLQQIPTARWLDTGLIGWVLGWLVK